MDTYMVLVTDADWEIERHLNFGTIASAKEAAVGLKEANPAKCVSIYKIYAETTYSVTVNELYKHGE